MEYDVARCIDSFEALKLLPSKSVDVIFTDPPYTEHVHNNLCSGSLVGTKAVPKYELSFGPLTHYAWLHDALRVARRWVLVFCALEDFGRFESVVGRPAYVRSGVWYKSNAMGQLTKDRPATAYEGLAIMHADGVKKRWNGRGSYGIWKCPGTRGKEDRHPNEKPIPLALKLTALFSDPGETILDPFCGSGALGEAALRLGRKYIGMDNDPVWALKARARLTACKQDVSDAEALALCSMK